MLAQPSELPLVAKTGPEEEFWQPEIFQNCLYRKPRCEHCAMARRTLAIGRTKFEAREPVRYQSAIMGEREAHFGHLPKIKRLGVFLVSRVQATRAATIGGNAFQFLNSTAVAS